MLFKFHDGSDFNAEAVKWSYDRVVRLEGDPNWLVTSFVEDVEVVDEYTVKYKLQNPVAFWPLLAATAPYAPLSPNCYSEDAIDADDSGVMDQTDAIVVLSHLFLGNVDIPAPGPEGCGPDPAADELDCEGYPAERCP